jgi:hypothetical protein
MGRAGLFFYSHLHDQLRFGKDYVEAFLRSERRSEDEPAATAYPNRRRGRRIVTDFGF